MTALQLLAALRPLVDERRARDGVPPSHDEMLAVYQAAARWARGGFQGSPGTGRYPPADAWACACPNGEHVCAALLDRCDICGIGRPEAT